MHRKEIEQRSLRWLNVGRWWLCGTGLLVAAPLVPELFRNFRAWHRALASDPSAADFWRTAFYLGLARFAAEMGLAVAIFFILKPRPNMFGSRRNLKSRGRADDKRTDER